MREREAWVRGLYDAFARGELERVLSAFDPKIEWNEAEHFTFWPGSALIGPEAVAEGGFTRIGATFGDTFSISIDRLHECGDTVIVEGRYTGTVQATGAHVSAQAVHVWDLTGESIVRFQQYTDTWQFAVVTGVTPVTV